MDMATMIYELRKVLWNLHYTQWKTQVLFSVKWWILVAIIAISYVIWWKIVDKRRLSTILLFGSLVAAGRIVMDIVGTNAVLWIYNIRELPFMPSPFLHDFTITPLAFMAAYQYSSSWKQFLGWAASVSAAISFVFFPLLVTFGYLTLYNWNYFYSFILILLIAVLGRFVVIQVLQVEKNYQHSKAEDSSAAFAGQPAMKLFDDKDDKDEK